MDGIGSHSLPDDFWTPLREAGGECRIFNPIALKRFGIRNHRKLLVCDEAVAFIGGSTFPTSMKATASRKVGGMSGCDLKECSPKTGRVVR